MGPTRRHVLGSAAAALALPRVARAALPRVGIVGGGMAGVATAWLLDGACDVTLFEAAPSLGGNARSVPVTQGGHTWAVDLGAQYFHPQAYPAYTALLGQLGLWPGGAHSFAATITVDAAGETWPRFVSPLLPGRAWPLLAPWNRTGLAGFQRLFSAAARREAAGASYNLALGDWLTRLGLDAAVVQQMLLPWAASLYSGDVAQAATLSARSAMSFAALVLPDSPTEPVLYHVLKDGMDEPLRRMQASTHTVNFRIGSAVAAVQRLADGTLRVQAADGSTVVVDQLVFAASGEPTLALLAGLPEAAAQRATLARLPFHDARLVLHTDAAYARADPALRSFLNCRVEGGRCEASMDLSRVLAPGPAGQVPTLWKSWVTGRSALPTQVLHEVHYRHFLPTPAALRAQAALAQLQGRDGLWIAGGYTRAFDAQETALQSALDVAAGLLPAARPRLQV